MKYSFGEFTLDTAGLELRARGAPLSVEPKVLETLIYLVENRDRVVTRDELIDAIWEGRFISDAAVSSAIHAARNAVGDSGTKQSILKTIHGRGFRFIAATVESGAGTVALAEEKPEQDIYFCHSKDGTRIAYSIAGEGPPLIKTSHWLTHVELDWSSPVWKHVHGHFAQTHQLIRYDPRGNGLSEWDVDDFSLDRQVEDLEAVVDAVGLDRFPILGISQAAAVSVAYAVKNSERVTKMAFYGGYACGWRHHGSEKRIKATEATIALIESAWGGTGAVQQLFSSTFMPDAPPENLKWFGELQAQSSNGRNAAKLVEAIGEVDVREILSSVSVPTLVLHARNDAAISFRQGQMLAAGIPGAKFVPLDTSNHILPETDPAWHRCARLIAEFLLETS